MAASVNANLRFLAVISACEPSRRLVELSFGTVVPWKGKVDGSSPIPAYQYSPMVPASLLVADFLSRTLRFRRISKTATKGANSTVKIRRAAHLGLLPEQLGISPDARIIYEFASSGVRVWDLSTGTQYRVTSQAPFISKATVPVPTWVRQILDTATSQLIEHLRDRKDEGWSDEREAVFTELAFRGVDVPSEYL
jgi:hypothetical protein